MSGTRITCPECAAVLRLANPLPGKAFRCPKCQKTVRLPAPVADADPEEQVEELSPPSAPVPDRPAPKRAQTPRDGEEDRPPPRRQARKQAVGSSSSPLLLFVLLGVGGFALCCVAPSVALLLFLPTAPSTGTSNTSTAQGTELAAGEEVVALAFSPDGKKLATASDSNAEAAERVKVWDAASGQKLASLEAEQVTLHMALSRDGGKLAAAWFGKLRVWNVSTKTLLEEREEQFRGPELGELGVGFTPDGAAVVANDHDGVLAVDLKTKKETRQRLGFTGDPVLAFSPAEPLVAVVSSQRDNNLKSVKALQVTDHAQGKERKRLVLGEGDEALGQAAVAFSGDGGTLAVAFARAVVVYDTKTWAVRGRLDRPADSHFTGVAVNNAGTVVALASTPEFFEIIVEVWAVGQQSAQKVPQTSCRSMALSPDGKTLAVGHVRGVNLFDPATLQKK